MLYFLYRYNFLFPFCTRDMARIYIQTEVDLLLFKIRTFNKPLFLNEDIRSIIVHQNEIADGGAR